MNDLQLAFERRNTLFIEARSKTKQEIEKFFDSIKEIPPSALEGITMPEDTRAEAIIPSMYTDPPNPEKYTQEIQAFIDLSKQVIDRIAQINEEAMQCLGAYM